ncbi:MAG: hypothetical protein ABJP48_07005 [Erythrobacter sp.]
MELLYQWQVSLRLIKTTFTYRVKIEVMKITLALFATTFAALCLGASKTKEDGTPQCEALNIQQAELLTPYEFTTIKSLIKVEEVEGGSVAFYNVDFEYSTKSVLFVVMYDGDILGDARAWYVNVENQVYISEVGSSKKAPSSDSVFVEYRTSSGQTCREDLSLF